MSERLIEDPVLRQRYRLTREGDVLRLELWAEPGARAPAHFHPRLEERIEVQEGEFTFKLGRESKRLGPGESVVVAPGARHSFANTGDGVSRFTAEIEPALTMEEFFEESAALARAGRFFRPGIPKGLRGTLEASEFADRHRGTTVMTLPPPALQPVLLPPLARLARRRARRGDGAGAKLPLPSRIMAAQYKVYDRMRHPRAFEIARQEGTAREFESLRKARQCLIVTFRRSGEPVPTPVNFGLSDDGKLYFRSEPHVAKIRRLRRDPHVRVCACNLRGKPRGPLVEGTARVLPESENVRARAVVEANWRFDVGLIERGYDRIGVPEVYVEVTPAG